jgi:hypothetical protein
MHGTEMMKNLSGFVLALFWKFILVLRVGFKLQIYEINKVKFLGIARNLKESVLSVQSKNKSQL